MLEWAIEQQLAAALDDDMSVCEATHSVSLSDQTLSGQSICPLPCAGMPLRSDRDRPTIALLFP